MPTRILIILFFMITFFGCGDSIENSNKRNENWVWWIDDNSHQGKWIPVKDKDGVKNGEYTRFYHNGKIFKKGKLKNGKLIDTVFYFTITGNPLSYSIPVGDSIHHYFIKDGYNIQMNQRGQIIGEGIVKNHVYGDQWKTYYYSGKIDVIQNLKNNFGWVTTYYENGNVRDSSYQYGAKGLYNIKSWYENGKIRKIFRYDPSYIKATVTEYFKNGAVDYSGTIINGLGEGRTLKYYESGKILGIVNRKNGQLDGYQQAFYENGKIKIEGYMKGNVADGEMKVFDEGGKLIKHDLYSKGTLIKNLLSNY